MWSSILGIIHSRRDPCSSGDILASRLFRPCPCVLLYIHRLFAFLVALFLRYFLRSLKSALAVHYASGLFRMPPQVRHSQTDKNNYIHYASPIYAGIFEPFNIVNETSWLLLRQVTRRNLFLLMIIILLGSCSHRLDKKPGGRFISSAA